MPKSEKSNKINPSGAESSRAFLAYAASELTTIEERKKSPHAVVGAGRLVTT
jgi:hypothetical protein